jgi:hypothetical protein
MKTTRLLLCALLAGTITVGLSCADSSPLAADPQAAKPQGDLINLPGLPDILPGLPDLVACSPLPYASRTQTIGPAGGRIRVGPHELWVPAGALVSQVAITAVAPSSTVRQVEFQPEGLIFLRPAFLTMSYANCNLLGLLLPKRIAYTTDALEIIEYLLSLDHPPSQTVTGRLDHFSVYAVAW